MIEYEQKRLKDSFDALPRKTKDQLLNQLDEYKDKLVTEELDNKIIDVLKKLRCGDYDGN